jgi:hypothetical protein
MCLSSTGAYSPIRQRQRCFIDVLLDNGFLDSPLDQHHIPRISSASLSLLKQRAMLSELPKVDFASLRNILRLSIRIQAIRSGPADKVVER